jgi:GNAT superfamily N-acetyltransferase
MSLRAIAVDLACFARRDGARAALRKVGGTLGRNELIVLVKRLDAIEPITFERQLEVSELGPGSLKALAELNGRRCDTRATERFAADLARGRRGFVAHEDGRLAGYYWWAERDHPHLDRLGVTLADGDVYGFDFFLAAEHRGDGRAVEFLYSIESALREYGFDRLWGYVRGDNRPARWLYSARGYEVVKHVRSRVR